jgi:hypothetical protein
LEVGNGGEWGRYNGEIGEIWGKWRRMGENGGEWGRYNGGDIMGELGRMGEGILLGG